MKKLLSVLLLLCMLLALLPVAALADEEEAAVAPAAEATAEMSAEDSAELPTSNSSENNGEPTSDTPADESADVLTEDEENEKASATEPPADETSAADVDDDGEAQTATLSMFDGNEGDDTMAVVYVFKVDDSQLGMYTDAPAVAKNESGEYHIPAATAAMYPENNPENSGYIFTGWKYVGSTDTDGKYIVENVASDAESVMIEMQAQWRMPHLELFTDGYGTVKLNDNTVGFGESWSCKGGEIVTVTVKPMEGYAVSSVYGYKWGDDYGAYTITPGDSGTYTFTMPSCDGSIGLFFEPVNSVTLTYHDGTSNWTERVSPNENVFLWYSNSFDTDQVMVGWALGSEDGEVVSQYSYRKFTQDTHLYAKYETGVAIRYHDGENATTNYAAVGVPIVVMGAWADGKTLVAWSDRALANGEGDRNGNLYYCGAIYTFNQATDLYPIYSETVTVKLHVDGMESYQTNCVKGAEYAFPTENFFGMEGVIDYWAVGSKDCATRYSPLDTLVINSNMEFYAVMATETVTVTLNSGDERNMSVTCDVAKGKPVHTDRFYGCFPDATGKLFIGWSKIKGGLPETELQTFTENTTLYAVWGDEIIVTYNANGGDGGFESVIGAGSYPYEYKESDHVVSRTGYKLKGWAMDKDGATTCDFTSNLTADTTLYAVWEVNSTGGDTTPTRSVHVSCNSNGTATIKVNGVEQSGTDVTAKVGDTVTVVAKPNSGYETILISGADRNGLTITEDSKGTYSFTVPSDNSGMPTSIWIDLGFYPDEALTITYHYQDANGQYTRTYAVCCLPDSPVYVEGGGDMTERVIYGWAVGSADSETLLTPDSFQTFKQDTELYAKYETGVKLTYHYANWDDVRYVTPKLPTYIYGVAIDETKFPVAWSTRSDGSGKRYEVGSQYTFEADTELYPLYADKAELASVTFHYTDRDNQEGTDTQWFVKGDIVWISNSYGAGTLAYWAVGNKESTEKYLNGDAVILNESLDLYAVMATETVNLIYCYGDGENEKSEPIAVAKNCEVILEYYPVAPLGMTLAGWSLERNGAPIENNRASFDKDTTLYAVWAKEILVTYDANGGVGGDQFLIASGEKLAANDASATRENHTFKGWATDKDGTTLFDFSKPITANITLYAVWEANNNQTGGNQTGGNQTGGDQPGGGQTSGGKGDEPKDNKTSDAKSDNGKKSEAQSPKTGDEGHIGLWLAVLSVSALAGVAVIARRKRGER